LDRATSFDELVTASIEPAGRAADPACLFCRIVAGEIPADRVHEDAAVIAIRDIAPRAPTHVLFLPREHMSSAADLTVADGPMLGALFGAAADFAKAEGLTDAGYRMVTNIGQWGGQTVAHLHVHLLGGRSMTWPPG
jgi:histidine triad (HIT) family protein